MRQVDFDYVGAFQDRSWSVGAYLRVAGASGAISTKKPYSSTDENCVKLGENC